MNGFGKALMGMIRVSMNRTIARSFSSGVTMLVLAGIVLLLVVGSASAEFACVADDGSGDAYFFGDTVMKSCTFNGSMSGTNSHGLRIGADDVAIDGAGYIITGGNTPYTVGIYNYDPNFGSCGGGHNNVAIQNLEISGFGDGIRVEGTMNDQCTVCRQSVENNNIYNCMVHDNSEGFGINFWKCVCNSTINSCTVYNITGTLSGSCDDPGAGIRLWGKSNHNNVIDNIAYHNDLAGIYSKKGGENCYNTISGNTVYENGQTGTNADFTGGIRFQCKSTGDNTIANNIVTDNFGSGIFIGGNDCIVRNNTVTGSKDAKNSPNSRGDGLRIDRGSDGGGRRTQVYDNTFCNNEHVDISADDSTRDTIGDDNTCNTTYNYNDTGTTGCTFDCSPAPDLTITGKSEEWIDQTNKTYNITYTVKNIGTANACESTTSIRIDGTEAATDPVPALAPDESYTATLDSFTMSDGSDSIRVCADKDNTVIEKSKEYNNCLENIFWYPDMPDLVITEKSEKWISPEDKTYNVTYIVKNIGNADASESVTSISIDGAEATTDPIEVLAPQETHAVELGPFTMSGVSDTIRVCADNGSVVEESNEDNNCLENMFELMVKPDLVISKKFEEWIASNETYITYNITYTIQNVGNADAAESTTYIIIDGAEVATDPVEALAEDETYTNTLGPFTMFEENDTIKVCADKNNDVDESNEDNNCIENVFEYSEIGCLAEDGTLFRCGNSVTRNCRFNGDMTCPLTHGLEIGANNVTVDGNNSILDGVTCTFDALSHYGIYNLGYDNVMIKDLEVRGFCSGIYLNNLNQNTIERCDIHHNGNTSTTAGLFGITMKYVYNSTIRNNTVHHQIAGVDPNPGCEDGGNGMFLYKGCYNNITYNDVYNNTKGGIFIKMQPMHNNISHNDLWDNGQGGIILRCMMSNYNCIEHNNASNNYGSGMFIGARENTIRYNTISDNRDGSPYYQDSVGGHGYGINLGRGDGSFDNYLHDNEICGNDYKDIYVVSGVTDNHGENNTCDTTYNYDDTGTAGCTYSCGGQAGVCGDVDGLPGVTTNDGRQIFMYLLHGAEEYPLADTWAADCDGLCDGITTNDGRHIFMHLLHDDPEHPEDDQYPLNCSC